MAFEFEEGLAGLAHVENADDGGFLGEGREEVGIVRRGGEAEEWRWEGDGSGSRVEGVSCW